MRPKSIRLAALALLLLSGPASGYSPPPGDPVIQVDNLFGPWTSLEKPGCAIGIAEGGRTLMYHVYGMADLEHDVRILPTTVFEAGSVSKQFTAAAVLLLEQQGKLALTDDVRKYVPELPDYGKTITIDHLIHHTSGLRDWGEVAEIGGWPRGSRVHTQAHALDIASRQKALNHDPGAEFSYTNTGYNLLAILVQRVSGQSFADFTRQQIFEPLGMTRTRWRDDFTRIVKERAVAYDTAPDGSFHSEMPFENVHGNGGLLTTVGDLLLWNESLVNGPDLIQALERPYRLNGGREIEYAAGLYRRTWQGVPEVSHSGVTGGYRSFLARYPEQRLSVVLLCNLEDIDATGLARRAAEIFLKGRLRPAAPVEPVQLAPEEISGKAGLYRSRRTGRPLRLVVKDGGLATGEGKALTPLSSSLFQAEDGARFSFEPGGLRLLARDGDDISFERVAEASPTPAQLAEYAGEYVSDEAEVTYKVVVEGGKLFLRARPDVSYELTPLYADAFLSSEDWLVRFVRDGSGKVSELSLGLERVWDLRLPRSR